MITFEETNKLSAFKTPCKCKVEHRERGRKKWGKKESGRE